MSLFHMPRAKHLLYPFFKQFYFKLPPKGYSPKTEKEFNLFTRRYEMLQNYSYALGWFQFLYCMLNLFADFTPNAAMVLFMYTVLILTLYTCYRQHRMVNYSAIYLPLWRLKQISKALDELKNSIEKDINERNKK